MGNCGAGQRSGRNLGQFNIDGMVGFVAVNICALYQAFVVGAYNGQSMRKADHED